VQIENPVRVLPLHSFCVGLKTAALSMVRHHPDVQRAIDSGLAAAAAHRQEGLLQKLSGQPAAAAPPHAVGKHANGQHGVAAAAPVQPVPGMER
jgi:hypothetical protein